MTALLGAALERRPAAAFEPASDSQAARYKVAPACPTWQEWQEALLSRLPQRSRPRAEEHDFTVEIRRASRRGELAAGHVGTLGSAADASKETRTVSGASCREVADALALIAALELQRTDGAPQPARDPEEPGRGRPTEATTDVQPPAGAPRGPHRLRLGASVFALLQSVTAPGMTADIGFGLTASWQTENLQPWLLLGLYWGNDEVRLGDGAASAHFERWSTYVVGCPVRWPEYSAVALRPCLNVDLGRLKGEGRGVYLARESSAVLASAGADVRFEWLVLDQLELGALVGGVLALARPRYFFAPEFTALQVPPLGLRTGASARLSF